MHIDVAYRRRERGAVVVRTWKSVGEAEAGIYPEWNRARLAT